MQLKLVVSHPQRQARKTCCLLHESHSLMDSNERKLFYVASRVHQCCISVQKNPEKREVNYKLTIFFPTEFASMQISVVCDFDSDMRVKIRPCLLTQDIPWSCRTFQYAHSLQLHMSNFNQEQSEFFVLYAISSMALASLSYYCMPNRPQ